MERINPSQDTPVILGEHRHRYNWVNQIAFGDVCDIACGMGYGSSILMKNSQVKSYIGFDLNEEAIEYAQTNFRMEGVSFRKGNCYDIPLETNSVDTVVSLETLEHLDDPQKAVQEFLRIVKSNGILLGSVPSQTYESVCTELYGKNPYHVQTFTADKLQELLGKSFRYCHYFYSSLDVVSIITSIKNSDKTIVDGKVAHYKNQQLGSILFIATNSDSINDKLKQLENLFEVEAILPLVDYDRINVIPRNQTIQDQAKLVDERDLLILKQDELIRDKEEAIAVQTAMIDERDRLIRRQDEMIAERDQALAAQAKMIDERDELIRSQDLLIAERDNAIGAQASVIAERDHTIHQQTQLQQSIDEKQRQIDRQNKILGSFKLCIKHALKLLLNNKGT